MIESFFLHSSRPSIELRIGVLLENPLLMSPYAKALEHIRASNFARLKLVIWTTSQEDRGHQSQPTCYNQPDKDNGTGCIYRCYAKSDEARHAAVAETLYSIDCDSMLSGVPTARLSPSRVSPAVLEEIQAADLDVILSFAASSPEDELLNSARFGIWTCRIGGDKHAITAGVRELIEEQPVTTAELQVERKDIGSLTLATAFAPTEIGISRTANLLAPCRAAETMIIEKLHQLHERGWDTFLASTKSSTTDEQPRRKDMPPTNIEMIAWLAGRHLPKVAMRRLRSRTLIRHWRTGIRPAGHGLPDRAAGDFRWLDGSFGHYHADPMLIEINDQGWLFTEDYDYKTKMGSIACAQLSTAHQTIDWQTVITRPYHLSFPFVFERDGEIFMIPESAQSGQIQLLRAVSFPDRWTLHHVLLDKPGLDTILHVAEDGTHYFFTSFRQQGGHAQLFLFIAADLCEPWYLHPASPICRDARSARGAGPLLGVDGNLYRPGQDTTFWYGRNLGMNRIKVLNRKEYLEEFVSLLNYPEVSMKGLHTFSRSENWEAIDGLFLSDPSTVGYR